MAGHLVLDLCLSVIFNPNASVSTWRKEEIVNDGVEGQRDHAKRLKGLVPGVGGGRSICKVLALQAWGPEAD